MTGEIVNDTVYERNIYVEDLYNIVISKTDSEETINELSKSIRAGTEEYQMIWERINCSLPIAQKGYLLDMKALPFSMDPRWWDKDAEEAFTLNGRLFFCSNDINVHTMESCSATYFSKTLATNYGLENPYTLVREKTWTLDKMGQMMRTVSNDANGDGVSGEGDIFGLVTGIGQYLSLINGVDARLVNLTTEGGQTAFTLNIDNEEVIAQTEAVCNLLNDEKLSVILNNDKSWGRPSFYKDEILFYIMQLGAILDLRELMETDFGVLPFPLRDENQKTYMTSMEKTAHVMGIPLSVTNREMIVNATEAMAIYSDQHLIDAFYETTLKGKIARDQDTTEMLDILTAVRVFDYSTCYESWKVYERFLDSIQKNGAEQLSSLAAKMQESFNKQQQKSLDALSGLQQ